jgi:uncharacterized integral membrane protein
MADDVQPRWWTQPKFIIAAVLGILALIFIIQNSSSRRVHVFFWSVSMPTWIWLLVVLVIGVIVGSVYPWLRPRKKD